MPPRWLKALAARLPEPLDRAQRLACLLRGRRQIGAARLQACLGEAAASPAPADPGRRETLAVVVPCYGHAAHLPAAIDSILAQTRRPDAIVFVDDASPDATSAVLERAARDQPGWPLRILRHAANAGQCVSINDAVAAAGCDLVMILNDDDLLAPNAVELALGLMRRHPQLQLLGFGSRHFGGRRPAPPPARETRLLERTPRDVARYRWFNDLNMTHAGCVFTRHAWQAVGGYQPRREARLVPYSDRDFQLRVNCRFTVGVMPRTVICGWRRDSSVDAGRNS